MTNWLKVSLGNTGNKRGSCFDGGGGDTGEEPNDGEQLSLCYFGSTFARH